MQKPSLTRWVEKRQGAPKPSTSSPESERTSDDDKDLAGTSRDRHQHDKPDMTSRRDVNGNVEPPNRIEDDDAGNDGRIKPEIDVLALERLEIHADGGDRENKVKQNLKKVKIKLQEYVMLFDYFVHHEYHIYIHNYTLSVKRNLSLLQGDAH